MIHLVDEVRMVGHMPYRWMFFIEIFCAEKNKVGGIFVARSLGSASQYHWTFG
jgi:hypothetical protein